VIPSPIEPPPVDGNIDAGVDRPGAGESGNRRLDAVDATVDGRSTEGR